MTTPITWEPSTAITWAPVSTEPKVAEAKPATFPLLIHCRSAEERDQIATELSKHGIKCLA